MSFIETQNTNSDYSKTMDQGLGLWHNAPLTQQQQLCLVRGIKLHIFVCTWLGESPNVCNIWYLIRYLIVYNNYTNIYYIYIVSNVYHSIDIFNIALVGLTVLELFHCSLTSQGSVCRWVPFKVSGQCCSTLQKPIKIDLSRKINMDIVF